MWHEIYMFRLFSVNFTFNVLNYKKLLIFDKSPSKIILFILHVQVVSFQFEELIVCVVTDCRLGLIVFSQTSGLLVLGKMCTITILVPIIHFKVFKDIECHDCLVLLLPQPFS